MIALFAGTTGLRDNGTTGQPDYETAHLQPSGFIPHPSQSRPWDASGFVIDFCLEGCVQPPSGLISWWQGEDNPLDSGPNGNSGTSYGGSSYSNGKVVRGFSFNGVDQYMAVNDWYSLDPASGITIDAWIKINSLDGAHHPIVSKDGVISNRQYLLTVSDSGVFRIHIGTPMGFTYTDGHTHITPGVWYHVAMTYDASSGSLKLYVNGTNDVTVYAGGNIIPTSAPLYIGGSPNANYPYYFPGLIDEVDIFDRALAPGEIQAICNAGSAGKCSGCCGANCVAPPSSIAGWWPGDGTLTDLRLGHPLTAYGNLGYTNGEVGLGFYPNGLGSYGKVASTPSLDVGPNDGMTIEAWVKPQDATARPIFEWCSSSTSGVHLWANYPSPRPLRQLRRYRRQYSQPHRFPQALPQRVQPRSGHLLQEHGPAQALRERRHTGAIQLGNIYSANRSRLRLVSGILALRRRKLLWRHRRAHRLFPGAARYGDQRHLHGRQRGQVQGTSAALRHACRRDRSARLERLHGGQRQLVL